jgi:hypothetical protein
MGPRLTLTILELDNWFVKQPRAEQTCKSFSGTIKRSLDRSRQQPRKQPRKNGSVDIKSKWKINDINEAESMKIVCSDGKRFSKFIFVIESNHHFLLE